MAKTVPNHIGIVQLDTGPTIFANLQNDVQKGGKLMISFEAGFQGQDSFVARLL